MPFQVGSVAVHDDVQHTGSAKRGLASGVASLDALVRVPAAQLALAELLANKNAASGYAGLDASVLIALAQQRLNFFIGSFSRDTSLATGNQAVTGVGFSPRLVVFIVASNTESVPAASIGWGHATVMGSVYNNHAGTADTWASGTTQAIFLIQSPTINYAGTIVSMDADGFTIGWTKTGLKTGSVMIHYIALR